MRAVTILLVFLASAWPSDVRASCAYTGPLCQNWKSNDAIFDGTVRSIRRVDRDEDLGGKVRRIGHRLVTFEVHEWWRGQSSREVELFLWGGTWPDGGVIVSPGFDVSIGERYVIFATLTPQGDLTTSTCSGSAPFGRAAHQLEFLRALKTGTFRPAIKGAIGVLPHAPSEVPDTRRDFDVTVRLTGNGETRVAQVKAGTRFEFTNLRTGVYTLDVKGPPQLLTDPSTVSMTLDDPQSCREVMVSFRYDTSISGLALDAAGKPVAGISIEAAPASTWTTAYSTTSSSTDENGRFALEGLPPGEYVVGVNLRDDVRFTAHARTLYSGSGRGPDTISVATGQHVWLGQWTVPTPPPPVSMLLRIVDPDGRPSSRSPVDLFDVTNPDNPLHASRRDTTDEGVVVFEGRRGRTYAIGRPSDTTVRQLPQSNPFAAESALSGLTVTLPSK